METETCFYVGLGNELIAPKWKAKGLDHSLEFDTKKK